MKLTFDSAKDSSNIEKHGLSLAEAKFLDWAGALNWIYSRKDYGEVRYVALVPMRQRLYYVVYVDLRLVRRIISLRKANNREVDIYEKENN